MTERDLTTLLQDMSLEEKVNQLVQLPGAYFQPDALTTGNLEKFEKLETVVKQAGSTLGLYGAKVLKELQKKQMKSQPHHIPMLFMLDVIHGYKTVFPCPLGEGATFAPGLVEKCAEAAAKEAAVSGIHVTFAPMADLVRDARWGRVMESTGEDAYLNGRMAEAMVNGFQGKNMADRGRVAACVKHFAGYGAPAAGREYYNVELSEHTMREYYFPAYEKAVKAGCALVMSAFHTWNGIPCSGNEWLLKKVLREEWGFGGVLISDWAAVGEMVPHGYCEDKKAAARAGFKAGTDIDMCANAFAEYLEELVTSGEVEERLLDEAVLRVLELKNKLGLFENPYKDADEEAEARVILCREHRELARKAVRESLVLLKNDNKVLPLRYEKIAFIGPYTDNADMDSSWAIMGRQEDQVSIKAAAEEMLSHKKLFFAQGCTMMDNGAQGGRYCFEMPAEEFAEENERMMQEAVRAAEEAQIAVLCLGEHCTQTGEAASRADITLPEIQKELLARIAATGTPIITVLFAGRPLDIREAVQASDAVLYVWLPGTEGGHGIMDVLTGAYNPSGKLPMSIPVSVGQLPISYDAYQTGRPKEGCKEPGAYRSGYLDMPNEPLYPFGYGLSYTSFAISEPVLNRNRMKKDEQIEVTVNVKNTGDTAGTEVLQLYIRDLTASRVRPVKQLKGFERVFLQPGEERQVEFVIEEEMLRFHRADGTFGSEPGSFRVWVENSSQVREGAGFVLAE